MHGEKRWLAPDYYDRFQCKGGGCRNSCCEGWGISVSMEEYFRLIGQECSPELHHRIECAFHLADEPSPERYALISPNWMGDCPMHDADGLCMLHRECGAEALPSVCRIYPRSMKSDNDTLTCVCSNSCERVIEMMIEEKGHLTFREETLNADAMLSAHVTEHLHESQKLCLTILQDDRQALPDRIRAIGRMLERFDETGSFSLNGISEEKRLIGIEQPRRHALKKIMMVLTRMMEYSRSLQRFSGEALAHYAPGREDAWENYERDCARFESVLPDWQRVFENILANHIFYERFPFADERLNEEEEYAALVGVYAFMRVVCAGYVSVHPRTEDFVDAVAGLFRFVEHTAFYINAGRMLRREAQAYAGMDELLLI